jgi:hypothetical protein
MNIRIVIAALSAAALSTTAVAAPAVWGHAKLAAPLAAPKTQTIGGVDWKCEGDACVATVTGVAQTWPAMYACKKVAAAFGTLAAYESSGVPMSAGNLSVCNKAAAH